MDTNETTVAPTAVNPNLMKVLVLGKEEPAPIAPAVQQLAADHNALPYTRHGGAPKPVSEMSYRNLPASAQAALEKWNRLEIQLALEEGMDADKRQFIEGKRDTAKAVVLEVLKRHPPYSNKLTWYAVASQFGYATPEQVKAVRDLIGMSGETHLAIIKSEKGVTDGLDVDYINKIAALDVKREGLTYLLSDMTLLERNCGDAAVLATSKDLVGVLAEIMELLK